MTATAHGLDHSSALMKNQKAAQLVPAVSAFEAVQTAEGHGLLFSIGDDGALRLCAERVGEAVVWEAVDLTADLPGGGKAKAFAVSHDPQAGTIALAQVVSPSAGGGDRLFVLGGLSDAGGATWMTEGGKREWVARPYEGPGSEPAEIAYVLLPPTLGSAGQICVAGGRSAETGFVTNYAVSLEPSAGAWRRLETVENYEKLIGSAIGRPQGSPWSGLYELYSLGEETGLTFTPNAEGAAPARKLQPPPGATALAVLPADEGGHTNLFVAGGGGVRLFVAADQQRDATGVGILTDPLFSDVDSLTVHRDPANVTIWARNGGGQVVSSRAPVAKIADPAAWSPPIPILAGAEAIASVANLGTGGSEIYVHGSERQLTKLEQDPVTTEWRRQAMTLPALAVDDMVELYTFTTHVTLQGQSSLPGPGATVELRSATPCAVYVEGAHLRLSPDSDVEVSAAADGTVTIVQQTETLSAVPYLLTDAAGKVTEVNPMQPALGQLDAVKKGADLDVTVSDERGTETPLVPPAASPTDREAAASAISELSSTAAKLPPGRPAAGTPSTAAALEGAAIESGWTLRFDPQGGMRFQPGAVDFDADDVLDAWWGDLVAWVEHALDEVTTVIVQVADGVAHVFVEIAGTLYHAVLRCLADAMLTFQLILRKLVEAFEALVRWLGMILSWNDILRTHSVFKSLFRAYLHYSADQLSAFRATLDRELAQLEQRIKQWSGGGVEASAAEYAGQHGAAPALTHPAANWGAYQQANNLGSSESNVAPEGPTGETIEGLLEQLGQVFETEDEDLKAAWGEIEATIKEIPELSIGEIVERLLGALATLGVETLANLLDALFDVLEFAAEGIFEALDAPIEIPVLSPLYERFTEGSKLSFLDLACLVSAIPVTIVFKLTKGQPPFPEDDFTGDLIAAPDLEAIRRLYARSAETGPAGELTRELTPERIWNISAGLTAFFASRVTSILAAIKIEADNAVVSTLYAVSYLFYCAPDYAVLVPKTYDVIVNEVITGISLIKTGVDTRLYNYKKGGENTPFQEAWNKWSPVVEFVIDAAWMFPTFAPLCRQRDEATWVNAIGGAMFNGAGMLSWPYSWVEEPEAKAGLLLGMLVLMNGYGFLMGAYAELS